MRTLFFLPDDPGLRAALEAELARRPKTKLVRWSGREAFERDVASADRKNGFALVDPPRGLDDLKAIDAICRAPLRAVFFAPPKPRKEGDPYAEYRAAMKEIYAHYHVDRRDLLFKKPRPKSLARALRLAAKADSIVRWGSLAPVSVLAVLIVASVVLLRDPLLHRGSVRGLEAAFGARAEVGGLSTRLTPALELRNVKVANRNKPMRNLFEFERLAGGVAVGPILAGRVHVEELAIEGLRLGTERSESGALTHAEASRPLITPPDPTQVADPLVPPTGTTPVQEPPPTVEGALEGIVKKLEIPTPDDLETVRRARESEKQIRERSERWRRTFSASAAPDRIRRAKDGLEGLKNIRLPDSYRAALEDLKSIKKELGGLDSARTDLEAVAGINFDAEKRKIESAKEDIEKVRKTLKEAEELRGKMQAMKTVNITDTFKVLGLVKDARNAIEGLGEAAKRLESATKSLEEAKTGIARKQKTGDEKLRSAEGNVAGARKFLSGGQGFGALAGRVAKAREDLDAKHQEVTGRLKTLKGDIETGRQELEGLRKVVGEDVQYVSGLPAYMKEGVEIDRKKLLERFDPENFTAEALVRALFGRRAAEWLRRGLAAYKALQPILGGSKDKKPVKLKRETGTTYHFPEPEGASPRVWIKKATIRGSYTIEGEPFRIDGKGSHLSSDLAASGQEARLDLSLEAGSKKIAVRIRATPKGEVDLEIEASGFLVRGRRIEGRHAPVNVGDGSLAVRVRAVFEPEAVSSDTRVALEGLKLTLAEEADPRYAFLREFLAALEGLAVEVALRWESGRLTKIDVRSDQMERLTAALRRALDREIVAAKSKAAKKVDEMTAGSVGETNGLVQAFLGGAKGEDRKLGDLLAGAQTGTLPDVSKPFADAAKGLEFDTDPGRLLKQTDQLEARRSEVGASFAKKAADQTTSAEGTQSGANDESKRLGSVKGDLDGEIKRLLKAIGR